MTPTSASSFASSPFAVNPGVCGPSSTPASRYPTIGDRPIRCVTSPRTRAAPSPAASVRMRSSECMAGRSPSVALALCFGFALADGAGEGLVAVVAAVFHRPAARLARPCLVLVAVRATQETESADRTASEHGHGATLAHLDSPRPILSTMAIVYAHRGAAAERPENTLASFRRALELGADALETDVHLTADGAVVAIHDADGARVGARRAVAVSTLAEVKAWDAGYVFVDARG